MKLKKLLLCFILLYSLTAHSFFSNDLFKTAEKTAVESALFFSVVSGDSFTLKKILTAYKNINLNTKNPYGYTPLHLSLFSKNPHIALFLIQQGVDVNIKTPKKMTALHKAIYLQYDDVIQALIEKDADINEKNLAGNTPLHIASRFGLNNTVSLLALKGADVNALNNANNTPLHLASLWQHVDTATLLITYGADPNIKNKNGKTPFSNINPKFKDKFLKNLYELDKKYELHSMD